MNAYFFLIFVILWHFYKNNRYVVFLKIEKEEWDRKEEGGENICEHRCQLSTDGIHPYFPWQLPVGVKRIESNNFALCSYT